MTTRSIYFASANVMPTLPLVWGLLRSFCDTDDELKTAYAWKEPLLHLSEIETYVEEMVDPSVLGLSCYMWNFTGHMDLCKRVKARFPGCLTVAGGPHIAQDQDLAFMEEHPYVDVLVHFEGETPFRRILKAILRGAPLDDIPGLTLRKPDGSVIRTGKLVSDLPRRLIPDEALPSPYLQGYFDWLVNDKWNDNPMVMAIWETSRGCPYACTFCEWGDSALSKMSWFGDERAAREFEWLAKHKIPNVHAADANFGMLPRDVALAEAVAQIKEKYGFPKNVHMNTAKNHADAVFKIIKRWNEVGLTIGATIAVQSLHEDTLVAIRRENMAVTKDLELQVQYQRLRIPTYVEFIAGLPKETFSTLTDGLCEMVSRGHHDIRCFELVLLPNTPLNHPSQREEHGFVTGKRKMIYERPDVFFGVHRFLHPAEGDLVFATKTMPQADWCKSMGFYHFMIATLHIGAYTKFLVEYLAASGLMTHRDFYVGLFEAHQGADSLIGGMIRRSIRVQERLASDADVPVYDSALCDDELMDFARRFKEPFAGKMLWLPADFLWLMLNVDIDRFYREVTSFVRASLAASGRALDDGLLQDLVTFQKEIMLRESYDPSAGKTVETRFNWPAYFFADAPLLDAPTETTFRDRAMGREGQYALVAGSPTEFALAATGNFYPDGRQQFYHHHREHAAWKTAKDNGIIGESLADYRARRAAAWAASAGEAKKRRESKLRVGSA